ncbi:MAG TPA: hypothetical protein VFF69_08235 [Phycisphaerales bacterium]|nr:hypothetical protein [Phycisphaerales bacterium]
MRPDEMKSILDQRPFVPVRLHMTNGETVDVTHPEAAVVTKSAVFLGTGIDERGVADRIIWYNLVHIVKVEQLSGEGRNGSKRSA